MDHFATQRDLKAAIRAGQPRLGLFVKTPAAQLVEAVAGTGIDFVVLDAEHGPFDGGSLDSCVLAGRANDLPVLVRIRENTAATVLEALDMGAAGVIAPHIASVEAAQQLVAACRYTGGTRGFSGLSRASRYGKLPAHQYRDAADAATIIVAQIEDSAGVENVAQIAAVDALDALFVGRADLAVSLGEDSITAATVAEAVGRVLSAGKNQGKATGLFLPDAQEAVQFRNLGASLFAISTDQNLLIQAVGAVARAFESALDESDV